MAVAVPELVHMSRIGALVILRQDNFDNSVAGTESTAVVQMVGSR